MSVARFLSRFGLSAPGLSTAGLSAAMLAALLASPPTLAAPAAPITPQAHGICVAATRQAELDHHLPPHLLAAISLTETGRWSSAHNASFAWPWTVMAEGVGRYLPSKQAAIAEVRRLQADGVRNIDVGCLQVNLHYHGTAFASLEEAFDPHANAQYAAAFLAELNRTARSWTTAVAHYHSRDPERGPAYRDKVYDIWYDQRDHLIDSVAGKTFVHTAIASAKTRSNTDARANREAAIDTQRIRAAAREANLAFLKVQAALTEARHKAAFEQRKAKALAAYRERKAKRDAARRGG
jgi:hypothetical protein